MAQFDANNMKEVAAHYRNMATKVTGVARTQMLYFAEKYEEQVKERTQPTEKRESSSQLTSGLM